MRIKLSAAIVLGAVISGGCGGDPERSKQRYLAAGDRYMAEEKYAEAVVQYRNAVKADGNFAEARFKLAEAFASAGDPRNGVREAVRTADILPNNTEAQLRAGTFLLLTKQFADARTRATRVLAKEPKNPRALVLLGNALAGLKDLDAAIQQAEQAVDQDPQLTLTYSNLGALQLAKGDREAAEVTFKRAVDTVPNSVEARLSLANYYWAVGKVQDTERELVAALKLDPKSLSGNRALGTLYVMQNRVADAEPYLKSYANISGKAEARLVLADYYVRVKKSAEAASILESLAQQRHSRGPATVRLAALDFAAGRRTEAYRRVEELLKEKTHTAAALQAKTQFLLLEGKYPEALAASDLLIGADGKGLRTRYLRGVALEATGRLEDALATYRDLLTSMPASPAVQSKVVELFVKQGRSKEALPFATQLVKARPRSINAHFLYGQALLRTRDLRNAERHLLAVERAQPKSAEIRAWVGMLYEAKGDRSRARAAFQKALELEPDNKLGLAGLVSVDLAEKKPDAALARLESRLGATPDDLNLWMMSAMAHLDLRNYTKAEAAYRRVLELDANNIEAYSRLSQIYWLQNRLDEAKASLKQLASQQAKPVAAETLIGSILVRQNKHEEARKHFLRALELDSRAAVAANNLAWDYANGGGNLDEALQLAQTAKAQLPNVAEITDTLGWIYYKKGLSSLAVTTLREAVKQSPSNPRLYYRLGLAHMQNGDNPQARMALEEALRLKLDADNAKEAERLLATIRG